MQIVITEILTLINVKLEYKVIKLSSEQIINLIAN